MKAGDNGILMEMMNGFPFRLLLCLTDCILKDSPASLGGRSVPLGFTAVVRRQLHFG